MSPGRAQVGALLPTLALVGLVACRSEPASSPARPRSGADLVVVSVDTLRADRLQAWGHHRDTSPRLQAFGATATRYAQAIAPSPWTLPSMATYFTGLAPPEHGVVRPDLGLGDSATTLAEELSAVGYETAFFGVNELFVQGRGLELGFGTWEPHDGLAGSRLVPRVLDWVSARDGEAPLLLWVHLFEPHCRYRPPPDLADRYLPEAPSKRALAPEDFARMGACFQLQQADGSPELDLEVYLARYDAEVREVDRLIGWIWEAVAPLDPLFVVVGDHGEAFWEHGDFGHGRQLFQESVHVPLWVRHPGQVDGAVVTEPVGAARFVAELRTGAGLSSRARVASEPWTWTSYEGRRLHAAVIDGEKLLHDEVQDSLRRLDLAGGETGDGAELTPRQVELEERLHDVRRGQGVRWQTSPAQQEALEALGYTGDGP